MAEIRIISRAEELAALQPQWWELWRRAAAPPFLSPSWLLPWWQVFRPGELRSIAVLDGARLSGLAALYCDRARLLPVGIALSDYLDVLVDPEDPRALPALAQGVRELPEWAECSLEELPPRAAALAHAIEAAVAEGCQEFHFLRGGEHYKYEWGAVDRCSVRRVLSRQAAHA